jgi:alpha-tubulin suppressor-like RCC1 family protein
MINRIRLEPTGNSALIFHVPPKRNPGFVARFAWVSLFLPLIACPSVFAGNYVVAWGDNTYGQTNVPAAATNVQAIAAGDGFSLALRSDGTVIAWGQSSATNIPTGLSNVVAIAAGFGQSFALRSDGTLVGWGKAGYSGVAETNIPSGLSNVVAVACGADHNLILKADGTVYAWGLDYSGQTNIPANLSNVVAIAAGFSSSFAIKKDGTTWLSGNYANQATAFSNAVAAAILSAGFQGAVLTGSGAASAWGFGNPTNITVVSNVTAVAGACPFNQAGGVWMLQRNATLTGLGPSYLGQSNVWVNLSNVLAVASGYTHHLAIVGDSLPRPIEPMSGAGFSNGQFVISQPTSLGRSYRLEFKNSLADDWQMFPPVPGNGSQQSLVDPNPPTTQRFYRIYAGQ